MNIKALTSLQLTTEKKRYICSMYLSYMIVSIYKKKHLTNITKQQ